MPSNPRHVLSFATALLIGFASFADSVQAQGKELVIFAAASLKSALDETTANWVKKSGTPAPKISYGPSNGLAKQIEQGAPADLFLSADLDWIDYAAGRNLIKPETRIHLLANRLALIAPADSPAVVTIAAGVDLAPALGVGRLAMADVDAVPAGKYGKAALEKLHGWDKVEDRIAQTDNVRAANPNNKAGIMNGSVQPMSPAEKAILERLGERREELEGRTRELEMRERLLNSAEKKLDGRVGDLKALEEKSGGRAGKPTAEEAKAIKNLVIMYESMKPKDAARVFDGLGLDVLVPVVQQMNPRKMSEVLAAMSPDRAKKLTVALASSGRSASFERDANEAPLPGNELPAIAPAPQR